MTMFDRLTIASVAFLATAISIIALSPMGSDKQPTVERTGTQLCREVTEELNAQTQRGMLTQERADEIIERCYKLYGGQAL